MKRIKHLIFKTFVGCWSVVPFKNPLKSVIQRFPKLKAKLYPDLRYEGIMNLRIANNSLSIHNPGFTTIENELYWNGFDGWEKISIKIWVEYCKRSKTILDIGANTGVYSLIASAVNPNAEVYCFEPVQRTFALLQRNLQLNPKFQIKSFPVAVSDKNGKATFFDVTSASQYSASLNEKMLENVEGRIHYQVITVALDDFEELKYKKIDLIKLDVEMHEPEALKGMINMIRRDKPTILIEILSDEIAGQIQHILDGLHYNFYVIDEINPAKKVESLSKSSHFNFLLTQDQLS